MVRVVHSGISQTHCVSSEAQGFLCFCLRFTLSTTEDLAYDLWVRGVALPAHTDWGEESVERCLESIAMALIKFT